MDHSTIFTKTAKGVSEAVGKTKSLSRDLRKVLKEIDGTASVGALQNKLSFPEEKLFDMLNELVSSDYVRVFMQPSSGDSSFHLTENVKLEDALSKLTMGDFLRELESEPAGSGYDDLNFRSLANPANTAKADAKTPAREEEILHEERAARYKAQMEGKARAEEQARKSAEENARKAAEEKAKLEAAVRVKKEAEEKAKREAEARARKEAEEKARREAEAQAKRLAEEQARRESELRAKKEAEEKAQREAEALAKKQAEEQARLRAQEQARREAEVRAKQEAEAQAKKLAEEQARQKAQELARRLAEEKARLEAIERAKKEAEEKARREEEEKAQRIAEEQAQKLAQEARRAAEEKERLAAEEQAKKEAEEKARREAESQARKDAEEQARLKAEDQARRAAELKAQREAEEQARKEAAEKLSVEEENRARQSAEEYARHAAELKLKRDAEERARKEAEASARQQAQDRFLREAEEKLKRETEALTQKNAAEQARREAEAFAKKEAEEQARLEAEEKSRREAEEKARRDAEAQAKREAEEKARIEAEERQRKEAEALAKREAEEKAARDAEELARKEAEERTRREVEEKTRLAAELQAKNDAEEKARQEAQAREQKAAEEYAKRQAEALAKKKAEEEAKREAEIRQHKEIEDQIRQQAAEKGRKEAEEKAWREAEELAKKLAAEKAGVEKAPVAKNAAVQAFADSEAVVGQENTEAPKDDKQDRQNNKALSDQLLRKDAAEDKKKAKREAREEAKRLAKQEAENKALRIAEHKEKVRLKKEEEKAAKAAKTAKAEKSPYKRSEKLYNNRSFNFGKPIVIVLFLLLLAGFGMVHVISFDDRIAQFEKMANSQFQQPVKIGAVHLALVPQPQWRLEHVSIGKDNQIKVPEVNIIVGLDSLFKDRIDFKSIQLSSPTLNEEALDWLMFGKSKNGELKLARISATNVKLESQNIHLPPFDLWSDVAEDGRWKKIVLDASDTSLHAEFVPQADSVQVDMSSTSFTLPFGSALSLGTFSAKATVQPSGMDVTEFTGSYYGGLLSGNAQLKWGTAWSIKGDLNAKFIDVSKMAPALLENSKLDGSAKYAEQAKSSDKLLATPHLRGNFIIRNGTLVGVDFLSLLRSSKMGGTSPFTELTGNASYEGDRLQLSNLRLSAGLISASGYAGVDGKENVNGNFAVDLRSASMQMRANLGLSGTLKEPSFHK